MSGDSMRYGYLARGVRLGDISLDAVHKLVTALVEDGYPAVGRRASDEAVEIVQGKRTAFSEDVAGFLHTIDRYHAGDDSKADVDALYVSFATQEAEPTEQSADEPEHLPCGCDRTWGCICYTRR